MNYLKPAAVAVATISMSTAPLHAGGAAEPLMEPEVIVAEAAAATSGGFVVPLILLVILAAAASSSGGGTPRE
ncbi:hypothetical protein [uncultured Boseongicola sp.]|jgi:hypothetical protein|uniref:hypothetical protein n=1 Tax=uncultured Boseongicola sp. TaxID=1648499 RepID=UPI00262E453D|nr:hypothetical protein [uncultured Boseongicola sp.]